MWERSHIDFYVTMHSVQSESSALQLLVSSNEHLKTRPHKSRNGILGKARRNGYCIPFSASKACKLTMVSHRDSGTELSGIMGVHCQPGRLDKTRRSHNFSLAD